MANLRTAFPSGPLIDTRTGEIMPAWRGFFLSLYNRTGSAGGWSSDTSGLERELEQETANRVAADEALSAQIATLNNTRVTDTWRIDQVLQEVQRNGLSLVRGAVADITAANTATAAQMVPIADLGTAWAALNLGSILPRTDPGHGRPWIDDSTLRVGSATPISSLDLLELQDGSGHWLLEDGTGAWALGSDPSLPMFALEDGTGHWVTEDLWGSWDFG